ncbi:MAG: hypothetical protein QJT81_18770 [Candidatus Thiothrix putei]|uniref:Uncharacterized protein n=1 Tax=Candidatus Thiothrix putei TaxID=3080811 RepID=A0AA95HCR4_9GAMM|nr:MAG: hypothetical protein QJT81_18770 [Candidatus Thiothrix putei]
MRLTPHIGTVAIPCKKLDSDKHHKGEQHQSGKEIRAIGRISRQQFLARKQVRTIKIAVGQDKKQKGIEIGQQERNTKRLQRVFVAVELLQATQQPIHAALIQTADFSIPQGCNQIYAVIRILQDLEVNKTQNDTRNGQDERDRVNPLTVFKRWHPAFPMSISWVDCSGEQDKNRA